MKFGSYYFQTQKNSNEKKKMRSARLKNNSLLCVRDLEICSMRRRLDLLSGILFLHSFQNSAHLLGPKLQFCHFRVRGGGWGVSMSEQPQYACVPNVAFILTPPIPNPLPTQTLLGIFRTPPSSNSGQIRFLVLKGNVLKRIQKLFLDFYFFR